MTPMHFLEIALALQIMCNEWKIAVHINVLHQNVHLCSTAFILGILGAVDWSAVDTSQGKLKFGKIPSISAVRKCGIQTVVINLLAHRLFHKHKGVLSLFAVHDTHQTVIVDLLSDYFKRQFCPY